MENPTNTKWNPSLDEKQKNGKAPDATGDMERDKTMALYRKMIQENSKQGSKEIIPEKGRVNHTSINQTEDSGQSTDEPKEEITPSDSAKASPDKPTPLTLSGEPENAEEEVITKEEQPKPFDADEIMPIEPTGPTVEDVSDILNQPQGQSAEAEQKPAETSPENPEALLEDQKEGKELKELEELRTLLAQAENRKKDSSGAMLSMDLPLENLRAEYEEKKEALARMLREKLTGVAGGQLNKEQ